MPRYREPLCAALDDDGTLCGIRMRVVAERDPSFGPNWRPGHTIFRCPRCGAIRALDAAGAARYAERIK